MVASTGFQQDVDKLVEAAMYLCELSDDDPDFGVGKLTILLYYADCESYLDHGKPITGTTYRHFPHGPHPDNWYLARERMEQSGDVEVWYDPEIAGYREYRLLPRRSANLELLSADDRKSLEAQVRRFAGFNAAGIRRYSHQEAGWLSTEDGEPISYELAGVVSPQLTAREIRSRPKANQST